MKKATSLHPLVPILQSLAILLTLIGLSGCATVAREAKGRSEAEVAHIRCSPNVHFTSVDGEKIAYLHWNNKTTVMPGQHTVVVYYQTSGGPYVYYSVNSFELKFKAEAGKTYVVTWDSGKSWPADIVESGTNKIVSD
ncbi:MAG TPA: hypothetical protein PLU30_26195 [Verrucomicrobiae bacterium]|nr:hypothetical protein [Verrucomicrobiae bacterium]